MRNIFNITIYELLNPGRPLVAKGDITPKKWFIEWCDANLSSYDIRWFVTSEERKSRRLGIVIENDDDRLLFFARWHGEWEQKEYNIFGPFTEEEMSQSLLPGHPDENGEDD